MEAKQLDGSITMMDESKDAMDCKRLVLHILSDVIIQV